MSSLLSAITGLFSNSPANKTSTSNNTSANSTTASNAGTSNYAQNLNPAQTQVLNPVSDELTSILSNPQGYIAPFQSEAINQVNDSYSGVANSLRQQFLATGGGTSGKYGLALASANQGRLAQISNVNTSAAQQAETLPLQATSLAEGLLGLNFGGTTANTGSASTTGSSTSNTTNVGAGSELAGALQGFTSSLAGSGDNLSNSIMSALLAGNSGGTSGGSPTIPPGGGAMNSNSYS